MLVLLLDLNSLLPLVIVVVVVVVVTHDGFQVHAVVHVVAGLRHFLIVAVHPGRRNLFPIDERLIEAGHAVLVLVVLRLLRLD